MSDKNSRRSILKKVGAATAITVGAGNVQARGQPSKKEVARAKSFEPVQSILDEINNPPLRPSDAQRVDVEGDNDDSLIMISFATEHGVLTYGRMEGDKDDHTASAMFKFDNASEKNPTVGLFEEGQNSGRTHENTGAIRGTINKIRSSTTSLWADLPEKYRDLPEDTDAMLLGRDDDVVFRRRGTDAERRMLAEVPGVDINNSSIVTGSDIDGFYVISDQENTEQDPQIRVTIDASLDLTPTDTLTSQARSADFSVVDNEASIQWHDSCVPVCAGCVGSITSCVRCSPACAGSLSGVGAVMCGLCLYVTCHGVLVAMCAGCAHCISENR